MDTSQQATVTPRDKEDSVVWRRQRWSIAQKRRIVEETLTAGTSVARVARAHNVNTNQVFGWRRLYMAGRLGNEKAGIKLLPVQVSESQAGSVVVEPSGGGCSQPAAGRIYIELREAQMRIEGNADPALLRVLLECLRS